MKEESGSSIEWPLLEKHEKGRTRLPRRLEAPVGFSVLYFVAVGSESRLQ